MALEQTPETEEEIKVEVIDDTPPEDRNRAPLPKDIVEELDKDSLDEYSDKVKTRISQMKKVWHDERREKERVSREREEAISFAQRALEENRQLKQRLGHGERVLINEVTQAATSKVGMAKDSFKRAFELGDADKIAEAQEALTDAQIRLKEYQNYRPSLQEGDPRVQHVQQTAPTPQQSVDAKAETWRQKNTWFGPEKSMTALALGLHEELVENRVDPTSDEYYQKIDTTMRKRFPEYFGEEPTQTGDPGERPAPRKTTTVVAPATRSTAPRQIRLTSTEASIAKRLGLTPEAYAREKIKLENSNG